MVISGVFYAAFSAISKKIRFRTFQGVKECIPCLFKLNLSIFIIRGSGYALLKVKVIWCTCVVHFGRCEKVEDSNFML